MIQSGIGDAQRDLGNVEGLRVQRAARHAIARLVLWREAYGQGTTPSGGPGGPAIVDVGRPIGGPNGPDQCRPGEGYHPTPCSVGGPAYGEGAQPL